MPLVPIITFKAGWCGVDISSNPPKITPLPEAGYVYLYFEDDLVHFCWRHRDQSLDTPVLDLVMVPTDGSFLPYEYKASPQPTAKTNGRIFVLKFASSSQRQFFWMQSKPQGRNGDPSYFSPRDRKIGDIVHRLLQGAEVNVTRELAAVRNNDDPQDDEDEAMEDVGGRGHNDHNAGGSGGAGADATGGDVREEGEGSREGGADGARAASSTPNAAVAVRNFLDSLRGQHDLAGGQQQHADISYPFLNHLLPTTITVPMIDTISTEQADTLLSFLPPAVIVLANDIDLDGKSDPTADQIKAANESLSLENKRALLKKVLRSPQFYQALGTLTMALRDGGLPSVADALNISVDNGGYLQAGIPMGGGYAVKAFVDGVKKTVQEKR